MDPMMRQAKMDALHTARVQLATEQRALARCIELGLVGFDLRECNRAIERLTALILSLETVLGISECDNCGERTTGVIERENGHTECSVCWRDSLAFGHLHGMHRDEGRPEYVTDCPACDSEANGVITMHEYTSVELVDLLDRAQDAIAECEYSREQERLETQLQAVADYVRACLFSSGRVVFHAENDIAETKDRASMRREVESPGELCSDSPECARRGCNDCERSYGPPKR